MLAHLVAAYVHVHLHGPRIDYLAVAGGATLSWAGVAGPGEALLIAASVAAARGPVDIGGIVAAAWAGAFAGGIVGWLVGLKAGRPLITAPGPFVRLRRRAVTSGDRFFRRFGALAVLFAPSWAAGINGMGPRRFVPANALAALVWAAGIGYASYLAGPGVADLADDIGLVGLVIVGLAIVAGVLAGRRRRDRP